nr:hypothetical protein HK105_007268 [Polyrhizophydium stewartii]
MISALLSGSDAESGDESLPAHCSLDSLLLLDLPDSPQRRHILIGASAADPLVNRNRNRNRQSDSQARGRFCQSQNRVNDHTRICSKYDRNRRNYRNRRRISNRDSNTDSTTEHEIECNRSHKRNLIRKRQHQSERSRSVFRRLDCNRIPNRTRGQPHLPAQDHRKSISPDQHALTQAQQPQQHPQPQKPPQ